jgi:hypothetical protein
MKDIRDITSKAAFDMTREEAQAANVCVKCKQPPTFSTPAGAREYHITAICEPCWDAMFGEDEDDE